jgi:hypothetical protein
VTRSHSLLLLLCIVLFSFPLTSCFEQPSSESGVADTSAVRPALTGSDSPAAEELDGEQGSESVVPLVDTEGATIVTMVNLNFDLERNEEQVLVVKDPLDTTAPLRVIVAAYDTVLQTYRIVYQEKTAAVNQRAFGLSFMDVVGDHNLEIICRGMDGDGRQTLDVFHRTTAPSGFGLYYKNIFTHSLNGSIEIRVLERSGAYQVGQANGVSFPIITQTHDAESENILDLLQRTFYWHFSEDSFIEGKVERILGEEIEQQQLRELYRRNAQAFSEFLEGSWYLADDGSDESIGTIILHFDGGTESFTYYTGELQEAYRWISTYKVLMSRVEINGENELVPFILKQFYVQIESLDTVRIRGNDPWQGLYSRLSPKIARSLASGPRVKTVFPELAGYYYSDDGNELLFEGNSFTLVEAGRVLQGGYALYDAGVPVLELRIISSTGLVAESRRYRLDFTEESRDNRVFRTLFLVPGIVGIYGFEAVEDTYTRFEQIETIESSELD